MRYDVIILSYGIDEEAIQITKNCIESLRNAEAKIKLDITVIENGSNVKYKNARTLFYKEDVFNYNQSMNYGIQHTKNDYIIMCNNDVKFEKNFADKLHMAFNMGYESLCPYSTNTHGGLKIGNFLISGYRMGWHLTGWCIAVKREIFDKIGEMDERVEFFYSDNAYREQLIEHRIKHALVCNSVITHLLSKTLNRLKRSEFIYYTSKQKLKFNDLLKENAKRKEDILKHT